MQVAKNLRQEHLSFIKNQEIDYVPSNDFSFYDGVLDAAFLINAVPQEYKELKLDELDTYFAVARGYQGQKGDVPALAMKKWFNTNYHYIVPEISDDTKLELVNNKPFELYIEAKNIGIETKPVIVGPFTFLKLAKYRGLKKINDFIDDAVNVYKEILNKFSNLNVSLVQIDEPILVTDLSKDDIKIFQKLYKNILPQKGNCKILLQTYFGDVRDCYNEIINLDFDAIGLDFLEGKKTYELIKKNGFPKDKILFAGVLNGKNIWKCNYKRTLNLINDIKKYTQNIVIQSSCSLLHVPFTLSNEENMNDNVKEYFSFAIEKLQELKELKELCEVSNFENEKSYKYNQVVFNKERFGQDKQIKDIIDNLEEDDFKREMTRSEREKLQKKAFNFPILPTTTIGSFPQTKEVKHNRSAFKKGEKSKEEYDIAVYEFIKECIKKQEDMDIDVLVHGEFERNDMVEFFGENLSGYVFTEKAWVQSYGTRCVKPPIIFY